MNIDAGLITGIPVSRIGWFLRFAKQRRGFRESLFRTPPAAHGPKREDAHGKSKMDTGEPLE